VPASGASGEIATSPAAGHGARASASGALPVKPGDGPATAVRPYPALPVKPGDGPATAVRPHPALPVKTGDLTGAGPAGAFSPRQSKPLHTRTPTAHHSRRRHPNGEQSDPRIHRRSLADLRRASQPVTNVNDSPRLMRLVHGVGGCVMKRHTTPFISLPASACGGAFFAPMCWPWHGRR
jgi:hypothetical protein